ncbi:MAG: hypothetical protein ACW96S_06775, partial [Promethearchaeota archaeon]
MNHYEDEIPDDLFDKVEEFNEGIEKQFEPMEEINDVDDDFNNYEPQDELGNGIQNNHNENILYPQLFDPKDEKDKVCGNCHVKKPLSEYGARMSRGKKIYFSRCKECRLEINQIYLYKNKIKIIENVYNGKLRGKCQICDIDVKQLPSLEFHHTNSRLKSKRGIKLFRNWEGTKLQVENEKAIILCSNCHSKQRSKYYNRYEKIIHESKVGPKSTNEQIFNYVKRKLPNSNYEVLRQVSRNIKKQIVINYLFEGKCVGCRDINIKNNLPALQFHHRDQKNPHKMSKTFVNLRHLECKEIIEKLKEENCVVLCANCHKMQESTHFKNKYEKIVKPGHWNQIKEYYKIIDKNLRN